MENQINTLLPTNATPNLVMMAMEKGLDVDKLEKLIEFQERSDRRIALDAYNAAMSECQSRIRRIATDKRNNQTNSDYATYSAIDRVIRPIYSECGFSLSFDSRLVSESLLEVTCTVSHCAGYSQDYQVPAPCDGMGAKGNAVMTKTHAIGSAISYGQRYLVKMIFNLAFGNDPDDDDGNGASACIDIERQINACETLEELAAVWQGISNQLKSVNNTKLRNIAIGIKDSKKAELQGAK